MLTGALDEIHLAVHVERVGAAVGKRKAQFHRRDSAANFTVFRGARYTPGPAKPIALSIGYWVGYLMNEA